MCAQNLINEPFSERNTTADFAGGCLGSNTSVFGPACKDFLCYSNHLQRAPYDAAFTKAWCKEMSGAIKAVDQTRRVTLGDLKASLQLTAAPSCTKEDGLDYYSLHVSVPHFLCTAVLELVLTRLAFARSSTRKATTL